MTTTILDGEETAATEAVGEEGPGVEPTTVYIGEEMMSTMAEGEEGPTLREGEDLTHPGLEDPTQSIAVQSPFGGF